MKGLVIAIAACVAGAGLIGAGVDPAQAQKAKDTIRFSLTENIKALDPYYFVYIEASAISKGVYDTLISYDDRAGKFVSNVAKSWSMPRPGVMDFDLRDDITFHNGAKLDADDIVYIVNWAIDPKSKIINKTRYTWVKSAEKLGPYKVRIEAIKPSPSDLLKISLQYFVEDADTHKALADTSDYGRTPVGTGPYRIVSLDPNTSLVAERFDKYVSGPGRAPARVKRLEGVFIPDQDVQIAQLVTGGIQVVRGPSPDQINALAARPGFTTTATNTLNMIYLQFDAANRTGKKELSDTRVRQALVMAIDRDEIVKHLAAGGDITKVLNSMCFSVMVGCDLTPAPPAKHDPAAAKRLLAEAGYPNGFDLELVSRATTQAEAVAIAGYWSAIGVKTKIQMMQNVTLNKARADGKLQAYLGERPWTSFPDAAEPMEVLFGSPDRDYWRDPMMTEIAERGGNSFDPAERSKIYKQAFDRINEQAYMLPIHNLPTVFVHSDDIKIYPSQFTDYDFNIADIGWK